MLKRLFLAHPSHCGETYVQHGRFALRTSMTLFGAAFAALIHAVVPAAFKTTASRTVIRLYPIMAHRAGASAPLPQDSIPAEEFVPEMAMARVVRSNTAAT